MALPEALGDNLLLRRRSVDGQHRPVHGLNTRNNITAILSSSYPNFPKTGISYWPGVACCRRPPRTIKFEGFQTFLTANTEPLPLSNFHQF
jgi:hypothetical protein